MNLPIVSLRIVLTIMFFAFPKAYSQVCTGALGDPVLGAGTDFGQGTNAFGNPLPTSVISYTYAFNSPSDGQYTLVKSTRGLNSGWHQDVVNRTPNDPNGYMLLVNADHAQGIFYQKTIDNLCPNNTYEFASWIINILRNPGIKPNVKFTIENNYQNNITVLKEFSTGDILEGTATDWKQYGTVFTTPINLGTITLKMTNINPGGLGNDLAIDDITFRPCGPIITSSVTNVLNFNNNIANICEGENRGNITLQANVSSGYNIPEFQWQELSGSLWVNSSKPGSKTTRLTVNSNILPLGSHRYRLLVAETGNINTINCRVVSEEITIKVNALPRPTAGNSGIACIGSNVRLTASEGASFVWTAPNGDIISTQQNPIINNITLAQAGLYTVVARNEHGCEAAPVSTNVELHPAIVVQTNINFATFCEDSTPIQLSASGGTTYRWSPSNGLSDPNIANPTASPSETTIYTVTVSNNFCTSTSIIPITIQVLKKPIADAGENKEIVGKKSTTLNGQVSGDNITVMWTPTDYLDDPTKINPIATPPTDITYKLTVVSECGIATDETFVKVYPELKIPNTFTPNGDNINDTWIIPAISSFENFQLKVFSRNGQIVYEGTKNTSPWNGKLKSTDADLPAGVYYYTLFLDNEKPIYKGWIMIVR
ncbi:MAG: gliding motility-associated C-terminal domain-containing protein [Pedobacter sp.]|uniref:T9SS type B sorting domain-containing protein n=1 Tax=Pedobacter sp. TaxID=1411316 RepID=UPI002807583F|nr:gliding motility-associated C-terminal domain-containing protein [Pedobacter sp.]MDQ8004067.1 gliding motility-associated C-terminal domain-containing protein [Pedobacter sp.]